MNGVLGNDSAQGYTGPGTNWANETPWLYYKWHHYIDQHIQY